jgi:2-polyprenyl-6-methoxyphenol hydroxylase-like FAD-dependent oxidoreductase
VTDVLVVGAGPTGLTLACDLARRGVDVRIIDKNPSFPTGSRGKGLSPRSLEVLDDLGVIDETLASGVTHLPHRKYRGAQVISEIDPSAGVSPTSEIPYPVGLLIPQWRVEQILRSRLADFGVSVELGVELTDLDQDWARYVVGCDGGHSTVRKLLGVTLRGETPDIQLSAVGDVEVEGLGRDAWHQWFAGTSGIMLCPLPGTSAFQVQASFSGDLREPTLESFQETFDRVAGVPGVRLHDLAWRSLYRVQVRMVDQLREGRVFLAGDAAHVHPIAGGLGMNTGIQDACNLGWKLGLVISGQATDGLLETYAEERLPIASALLSITSEVLDLVFEAIEQRGGGVDAAAVRDLSQLNLNYAWSSLSRGPGSGHRAPDGRLPTGERLFDVFRGPHFTLLTPSPVDVPDMVKVRVIEGSDTLTLVRPDGYIGLTAPANDPHAVHDYLSRLRAMRIRPGRDHR